MVCNNDKAKVQEHYVLMTESPLRKLVMRMAVPNMISMVAITLYGIVDSFFVGSISTEAIAGVAVSAIFSTFTNALGFFFGNGSGIFLSRALGNRQNDEAERMSATGFFLAFGTGIFLGIGVWHFSTPVSYLCGANSRILPYAVDYLNPIALMTPFFITSIVLNNQLRLQGKATFSMIGILSGAVLNILFDPLFINVLDMDVKGAAYATCLSQFISWMLLLWGTKRAGSVHVRFSRTSISWRFVSEIFKSGTPAFSRQILQVVSGIIVNRLFHRYSPEGTVASQIAAYYLVSRIMTLGMAMVLGLGQGFQAVCAFNYGAGLFKRVLKSYMFCIRVSFCYLVLIHIISMCFSTDIIALFRPDDPVLISAGARILKWQCMFIPLIGACTMTNMITQNIGLTWQSIVLAISRHGLCFIPTAFILSLYWGVSGLQIAQGISDLLTIFFTLPFVLHVIRLLKKNIRLQEEGNHQHLPI